MPLGSILPPGYRAFKGVQQANQQGDLAELQNVQGAMGLMAALEKRKREQAQQAELQALGATPTPDALALWAAKHSGPEAVMRTQQQAKDREQTREVQREAAEQRREQAQAVIDMRYDALIQQAGNEAQKNALEARRIADKAAADKRHDETLRLLGVMRKDAAKDAQPKAPPGFRYRADGSGELEAIPGGPKDTSKVDAMRLAGATERAKIVSEKVDQALAKTGFFSTGATGAVLGMIPGTAAYDLEKTIDTIKANIGFKELQAMREASPTGGALGQVAVQELNMLQSVISSLDKGQSPAQLKHALGEVKAHYENWKNAVSQAAAESAATAPQAPAAPAPIPAPAPRPAPAQFEEGKVYMDAKGNKARFQGGKFVPVP